jgi:hypothetical protein
MDDELKRALDDMEVRITERIFDLETKLLSAFRDWQQPVDLKLRALPLMEQRLDLLEGRITKLEQKEMER